MSQSLTFSGFLSLVFANLSKLTSFFTCQVNAVKIFIYYFRESLLEEAGAMPYVKVPNEMYVCLFLGAAVLE
jgi:hypothetical protein